MAAAPGELRGLLHQRKRWITTTKREASLGMSVSPRHVHEKHKKGAWETGDLCYLTSKNALASAFSAESLFGHQCCALCSLPRGGAGHLLCAKQFRASRSQAAPASPPHSLLEAPCPPPFLHPRPVVLLDFSSLFCG